MRPFYRYDKISELNHGEKPCGYTFFFISLTIVSFCLSKKLALTIYVWIGGDDSLSAACKRGKGWNAIRVCLCCSASSSMNQISTSAYTMAKAKNPSPNITKVFFVLTLTHTQLLAGWLAVALFLGWNYFRFNFMLNLSVNISHVHLTSSSFFFSLSLPLAIFFDLSQSHSIHLSLLLSSIHTHTVTISINLLCVAWQQARANWKFHIFIVCMLIRIQYTLIIKFILKRMAGTGGTVDWQAMTGKTVIYSQIWNNLTRKTAWINQQTCTWSTLLPAYCLGRFQST